MHRAAGTLEIHYIEFFVKESVKADLAISQPLIKIVKHLLIHVIHRIFAFFTQLEKIT